MRQMLVSPGQKLVLDGYSRLRLFDVGWEGGWTEVRDLSSGQSYQKKELRRIKFDGKTFTADYPYTINEPNAQAIQQHRELVQTWRDRGRNDLADKMSQYYDDEYNVVLIEDLLTDEVEQVKHVVIVNPTFLALKTWIGPFHEKHIPSSMSAFTPDMLDRMRNSMTLRGLSYE